MEPFKKNVTCIKAFFIPSTYIIFFVCITAPSVYHVISKEIENRIMDRIAFLDTHVCVNNPNCKSSGIKIFLCKYYIVISDTLIGYWMYFP